jgi:segregation and condensation protein A
MTDTAIQEQGSDFKIKTTVFEGPLEVLLNLIEKRKLLINDISLAQITDDFIAYTQRYSEFPTAQSADFILVASTLLLIKSKSLLPSLALTSEEQADIQDLETRLKIYKRIKELSVHVKALFGARIIFERAERRDITPVFSPEDTITLSGVLESLKRVIASLPKKEFLPKAIVRKVISLEEMIGNLADRIQSSLRMSFRQFSGDAKDKVTIIVGFLAMLELVKQGAISVNQDARFGDIDMETSQVGVPNYH